MDEAPILDLGKFETPINVFGNTESHVFPIKVEESGKFQFRVSFKAKKAKSDDEKYSDVRMFAIL